MASKFRLQIVTPDRTFLDEEVEMAVVRTVSGDEGILSDHMLMVTPLKIGKMKIQIGDELKEATIAGGFIQVDQDKTIIITDAAEWPEEIDVSRAEEAKQRAEERLQKEREEVDTFRAEIALKKATNRLGLTKNK
ncbi:ATP synthase F1, epsilon subunit [Alkaliphilus metalliredigens QYMF]|uniref:ATP synthase epsilon chain n=1 Tax=Alkaliphilus metalliredigens (strain QYMF) TaxID=293826 RepID=ATPE_ALKMQ|nr:F0F1 ATP synthase subunit epsilon [Alkaliphilus metalliredigens]A6TK66.1 RecName: Full=ATP synthase epsilon chain; AltName: Full=ATP synthase F1 sector epsilon subunit; AltName: Full=F-ATPase epsilon subunit [Alkaliphilus metalliredigens QYMF]ABR46584.1 ATP synthase F1, epsilon subunit [Alkaliphilus metalliredigens QYMF]